MEAQKSTFGYISNNVKEDKLDVRKLFGETIKFMKDHKMVEHDEDITSNQSSQCYKYLSTSSAWTNETDDLGDWNDVTTFINSNKTLKVVVMVDAWLRFELLK